MTVAELKRVLSDLPEEMQNSPVVVLAGRMSGGENIAAEIRALRQEKLVPVTSSSRKFYTSPSFPGEREDAQPVIFLVPS